LCYKSFALESSRYKNSDAFGEEPSFLNGNPVLQHPDIGRVHIALAHFSNTVTKKNYVNGLEYQTNLTLEQMGVEPEDCVFYRSIAHRLLTV